MIEDVEKSLLKKFLGECAFGTNTLNAARFRADHYEQLSNIDTLERLHFLERRDEKYELRLIALPEIKDDAQVALILNKCNDLFHILHKYYRSEPGKPALITELAAEIKEIEILLPYFSQAHILSGYSKSALTPGEGILKYKSFYEIVDQLQKWNRSHHAQVITRPKLIEKKMDSKMLREFLHPKIVTSSIKLYEDGHIRDAVLNSIVAVFDFIRERTKLQQDGESLINTAFSLTSPYLIFTELESESGLNDQKGFIQIFKGAYQGIRNPKAHSLSHDLNHEKAVQYLFFASLLARRIDEATLVKSAELVQKNIEGELLTSN